MSSTNPAEAARKKFLERMDKISKHVEIPDAWALFYSLQDKYDVKTPGELIELWRNGQRDMGDETISIMLLIC